MVDLLLPDGLTMATYSPGSIWKSISLSTGASGRSGWCKGWAYNVDGDAQGASYENV